jgi:hypothetical protein
MGFGSRKRRARFSGLDEEWQKRRPMSGVPTDKMTAFQQRATQTQNHPSSALFCGNTSRPLQRLSIAPKNANRFMIDVCGGRFHLTRNHHFEL